MGFHWLLSEWKRFLMQGPGKVNAIAGQHSIINLCIFREFTCVVPLFLFPAAPSNDKRINRITIIYKTHISERHVVARGMSEH